jgi:hypothetical protein
LEPGLEAAVRGRRGAVIVERRLAGEGVVGGVADGLEGGITAFFRDAVEAGQAVHGASTSSGAANRISRPPVGKSEAGGPLYIDIRAV